MTHSICRACGSKHLFEAADFGTQVPANSFRTPGQQPEARFPLQLLICAECWLGQTSFVVPKEALYLFYPYITSTSKTMADHLLNQCQNILRRVEPLPKVVEIGSNTGPLLKLFQERHSKVFGFEPAKNVADAANESGIPTLQEFFNQATASAFVKVHGKADVVIGRHVFAHIDCWRALVSALDTITATLGLVVLEVPYVVEMLDQFQFDTVYHEHLSYVSLKSVETLLEDSPFYVQDVERCLIHGGSIIFYLRRRGASLHRVGEIVEHLRILEETRRIGEPEIWKAWASGVEELREDIIDTVRQVREAGIAGYGASAKGSMLLQYCGLGAREIQFVADYTPSKQGKCMPGTDILVVPSSEFYTRAGQFEYALILAWNFAREIKASNERFKGRWITPIPQVRIE